VKPGKSSSKRSSKRPHTRRHRGVTLVRPNAERRIGWRARYRDPDTGKTTWETLGASLSSDEARAVWAVAKSRAIAKRQMELEGGAPRTTGTALDDAIKTYFDDHPQLRAKTTEAYEGAADKFKAWASRVGLRGADDLTGQRLVAFRAELVKEKKSVRTKGRTARVKGEAQRSPHTVNRELRSIGTILEYLRSRGLLPRLSGDALRDGLKKLRAPLDPPEFLRPAELQRLLDAATRHDAETFAETRDEHGGNGKPGTTPRYPAIAPFVAFLLLTGMRRNEALAVEWRHVDLEALDGAGKKAGEITLTADMVKTHRGRTVVLEVSPALRKMLAAMRLKAGGKGRVFALTPGEARSAERRIIASYGAPSFSWQVLRQSCGTFLTNSPAIFHGASAYRSAKQLGHSVAIAERHYLGLLRGVSPDARDLETAMQVAEQLATIVAAVGARPAPKAATARA
jgi:integrase